MKAPETLDEQMFRLEVWNLLRRYSEIAFQDVSDACHEFLSFYSIRKSDEFLIKSDEAPALGLIIQGLVAAFYGRESQVRSFALPGQITGSTTLAPNDLKTSDSSRILAVDSSVIAVFSTNALAQLTSRNYKWEVLFRRILEESNHFHQKRQYDLMMLDAAQRYESFRNSEPVLLNRLPLYLIASYLGIAPETLSRIRKKRVSGTRSQPKLEAKL
jgi:CRP-like cAMP-binding protein